AAGSSFFFSSFFSFFPSFLSSFLSSDFFLAGFSSSLSRANGDGTPFFSTTRYGVRRRRLSALDWADHWSPGPASVEARKYRYLPPASKTGSMASLSPSVIAFDLPLSRL